MAEGGILKLIGSYNFVEKDPAVDLFIALRRKETKLSDDDLAVVAKLNRYTVRKLYRGDTIRPAHLTLQKLAIAMNHRWQLVPATEPLNYEVVLPKAWEAYHEHEAALKAKRIRRKKKANGRAKAR
jgi:hypothetical protein